MFADANIDDFYVVTRKRNVSLLSRFRNCTNGIPSTLSERDPNVGIRLWCVDGTSSKPIVSRFIK